MILNHIVYSTEGKIKKPKYDKRDLKSTSTINDRIKNEALA